MYSDGSADDIKTTMASFYANLPWYLHNSFFMLNVLLSELGQQEKSIDPG
jgi:hypothetical protein